MANRNVARLVNIRREPCDVYIGRPKSGQEWAFGNPFRLTKDGELRMVVKKHLIWLVTGVSFGNPDATFDRRNWILSNIHLLKGQRLGCFCDGLCHGMNYLLLLRNPYLITILKHGFKTKAEKKAVR